MWETRSDFLPKLWRLRKSFSSLSFVTTSVNSLTIFCSKTTSSDMTQIYFESRIRSKFYHLKLSTKQCSLCSMFVAFFSLHRGEYNTLQNQSKCLSRYARGRGWMMHWKFESAFFESLEIKSKSIAIPKQYLHMCFIPIEKNIHVSTHRVELHLSVDKSTERIKSFAHIGDASVHKVALMFGDQ